MGVARDIECIKRLTAALRAGESLTFDANRAWTPDEAIRVMNQTEPVDAYFEQPCETFEQNAMVRRATRQPIILDESIKDYQDIVRASREMVCEAIGLKINRVGGLTKARRIRDFCVEAGIVMNIEETGGSALADSGAVHLAQATPTSHLRATWLCQDLLALDPIIGGSRNHNGETTAPKAPGIGAEPNLEMLGDPVAVYRS